MSHELQYTGGRADFFEVGQKRSAWHREGVLLEESPTLEQAMALAHLDYEVVLEELYRVAEQREGEEGASYMLSSKARVTVRTDTRAELGSVGPDYTVVQNRDAFAVLTPLLDAGLAKIETGGVLRNGADAWLLTRWNLDKFGPVVKEVFADEVVPYGLLAVNHSGRRGILLADTPIRVVCANTLGAAEQGQDQHQIKVRHTGDAEARLTEAAMTLWGGLIERFEVLAQHYRVLKGVQLDQSLFRSLVVKHMADDPRRHPRFNPDARMAEVVVARYEKKVETLEHLWRNGAGHTGDGSAWEAYNAAVEAADHHADLWPTRGGTYRTASLLDGVLAQRKRSVLKSLIRYASKHDDAVAMSA